MKVDQLHILRIVHYQGPDPALMKGTKALYDRYVKRGLGSVIFWEYNTSGRQCRVLERADKPILSRQNVGLYVVGNGNMMEGLIGVDVAALGRIIRHQMRIWLLRKLCLVSSYLGETMYGGTPTAPALKNTKHQHEFETYVDAACAQLAAIGYDKLMTAGWANEIYINDDDESIVAGARVPSAWGKKLGDIRDGSRDVNKELVTTQYRKDNKVYRKWDAVRGVIEIPAEQWHDT